VHLEPLRAEHFDALYAVASDPLIWEQHPERERYRPEVFRKFFDDALASGGALVARDAASGAVIGSSRFHWFDAEQIEIGWSFLARAYWGGRYNGEMKRLMLTHAFQSVDRVILRVGPGNIRSQRAVERIGGVNIGIRYDAGVGREAVVLEIAAERFRGK
jgi:RimJ/RimL family protein N-acetyltransferase